MLVMCEILCWSCVTADEAKGILKWADGKAVKSEVDMQVCNCLSVCTHVCVCVCMRISVVFGYSSAVQGGSHDPSS